MRLLFTYIAASALIGSHTPAFGQEISDSIFGEIDEIIVTAPKSRIRMPGAANTELITASELKRAACCNLGESFTTNPSVDVNYSDAATGARQIRLLGLSGSYVQMMTENIPNFRGVATPYGLGYIPGPWIAQHVLRHDEQARTECRWKYPPWQKLECRIALACRERILHSRRERRRIY